MRKIKLESEFEVYASIEELPESIKNLMSEAVKARTRAYSPYSNFSVGAAVLVDSGEIITGSNQENASYPSGLCAERTALFSAASNFPGSNIEIIAICAGSTKKKTSKPIPPCGACRQVISEYEINQKAPITICFMGETGEVVKSNSLSNLLPLLFNPSEL